MTAAQFRSLLYLVARIMGDIHAVQKGKVGRRLLRRVAGKATGRAMGRVFG